MEGGQGGGAPHTKNKRRKMMEREGVNEQQREKRGRGAACRGMKVRKGDTRMKERSDSCLSFYKRSAAMCLLPTNTAVLQYAEKE